MVLKTYLRNFVNESDHLEKKSSGKLISEYFILVHYTNNLIYFPPRNNID